MNRILISLIILVVVFVAAIFIAWPSDEEIEKAVHERRVADHLAVLDAWVATGDTTSGRGKIADSCGMLLHALSDDDDFEMNEASSEKLYFCQDITAARISVTPDEFRRIQQICTDKDDSFHQVLCRHSDF